LVRHWKTSYRADDDSVALAPPQRAHGTCATGWLRSRFGLSRSETESMASAQLASMETFSQETVAGSPAAVKETVRSSFHFAHL